MTATIDLALSGTVSPLGTVAVGRTASEKMPTKMVRLFAVFATKLSVIANAMAQVQRKEVSLAEAAEDSLGESLDSAYVRALEQLSKLKRPKQK